MTELALEEAVSIIRNACPEYYIEYCTYETPEMYMFSVVDKNYKEMEYDASHIFGVEKMSRKAILVPGVVAENFMSHIAEIDKYRKNIKIDNF